MAELPEDLVELKSGISLLDGWLPLTIEIVVLAVAALPSLRDSSPAARRVVTVDVPATELRSPAATFPTPGE